MPMSKECRDCSGPLAEDAAPNTLYCPDCKRIRTLQKHRRYNASRPRAEYHLPDHGKYRYSVAQLIQLVQCRICQRTVRLVGLRSHIGKAHNISIREASKRWPGLAGLVKKLSYNPGPFYCNRASAIIQVVNGKKNGLIAQDTLFPSFHQA